MLILELQAIYAGLIGEKLYYKEICGSDKFPMHLRIGSSYDLNLASQIIRKNNLAASGKRTRILKKGIQLDVEQILRKHWEVVKIVAHALFKKRKLSFDELKSIIIKKTDDKDFWKDKFKKIKMIHNTRTQPDLLDVKEILLEDAIFDI
jgi:hypothetical protein